MNLTDDPQNFDGVTICGVSVVGVNECCYTGVTKVLPKLLEGVTMKTITIKASDEFAQNLVDLAGQLHLSKSELIRQAVERFRQQQEQTLLKAKMQAAAQKVRSQTFDELNDWEATLEDGLKGL